jgi:DNA-binding MarR family transcriptional regulator
MPRGRTPPVDPTPAPAPTRASDLDQIDGAMRQMAYLFTRYRYHSRIQAVTGVSLGRAAVSVLMTLDLHDTMRIGELAAQMDVEAPHVTRQVRLLEPTGYVTRVTDPSDKRAQIVRITAAGRRVTRRISDAGKAVIRDVLGDWTDDDLHHLSLLFRRMVDDIALGAARDEDVSGRRARRADHR